jgi:hypothetical protein
MICGGDAAKRTCLGGGFSDMGDDMSAGAS